MHDLSTTPAKGKQPPRQPQYIRDDVAQEATLVCFYAGSVADHAAIGDDSGLAYAIMRLTDHVRTTLHHHRLLRERKAANTSWWEVYGNEFLNCGTSKAGTEEVPA